MRNVLDWIPIQNKLLPNVTVFVHEILNSKMPKYFMDDYVLMNVRSNETKNVNRIKLPHVRKTVS